MLSYLFLAILPAALLIASVNDIIEMKIPNWISLMLILTFPFAAIYFQLSLGEIAASVLLGLIVLAAGFTLFALNLLGGGDAKLIAAVAPWLGLSAFAQFAIWTVMAGGALAILLIIFRKTPPYPVYAHAKWVMKLHNAKGKMPYGAAIAVGGLYAMPQSILFASVI